MPVTIQGIAHNTKTGAIVIDGEEQAYYVEDLAEWEETLLETPVEVTGELFEMQVAAEPGDEMTPPTDSGTRRILQNAQWKEMTS